MTNDVWWSCWWWWWNTFCSIYSVDDRLISKFNYHCDLLYVCVCAVFVVWPKKKMGCTFTFVCVCVCMSSSLYFYHIKTLNQSPITNNRWLILYSGQQEYLKSPHYLVLNANDEELKYRVFDYIFFFVKQIQFEIIYPENVNVCLTWSLICLCVWSNLWTL